MKTYNCAVRLGGNMLHDVGKENVTSREIQLLQHIHGADSVINIVEVGERDVTDMDEYRRLSTAYSAVNGQDNSKPKGTQYVEQCFGVKLNDLDAPIVADVQAKPRSEAEIRADVERELRAKIEAETLEKLTAPAPKAEPAVAEV